MPERTEGLMKILLTPDPGLAIVRFWQGVVEIVLRVLCIMAFFGVKFFSVWVDCMLLAIGLLVATALTVAQLQDVVSHIATVEKRRLNTVGAAAWLVVVSSVGIVLETLFIIIRFCNCDFVRSYRTPLVVDMIVSVGVSAATLAGSIALAVFTKGWADSSIDDAERITRLTASSAGIGIGTGVMFFVLAAWSALFILNGWTKRLVKYSERL